MSNTMEISEIDVIKEGNVKVILPWDNRVGEIWDNGVTEHGHTYGIYGLNADSVPVRMKTVAPWEYIMDLYKWRGKSVIRRAPEWALEGDIVC